MPMLIEHIDKIARDKGRDVLYIVFDEKVFPDFDFEMRAVRKTLIAWFDLNNIKITPCGNVASEHSFSSYHGQLYIDVPYDENHPDYKKVSEHLECADGSFRILGVIFCYLPLEHAMRNKHHDELGFWDKWAENF